MPITNASPMGFLWRFMGLSRSYAVFTGLAETAGGLLLFFRRTTTLGALVAGGVMLNVVMLNFSYDVPVKLGSSHLFLASVFLLLPDLRRLAAVLLLNRPAPAADLRPPRLFARFPRAGLAVKLGFVLVMLGTHTYSEWDSYWTAGPGVPLPPLYGAYEVESFEKNGEVVPPLLTETKRWRRVAADKWGFYTFFMNDTRRGYRVMEHDAATGKLILGVSEEEQYTVSMTKTDPERYLLEGKLGEDNLSVRLKKIHLEESTLLGRGFHWVTEVPFQR